MPNPDSDATNARTNTFVYSILRCKFLTIAIGFDIKHCQQISYEIQPETAEGREQTYSKVLQEALCRFA